MRAGRGFRMILNAEGAHGAMSQAGHGIVVEIKVRDLAT